MFGHDVDDHVGEDNVVVFLAWQFFGNSLKFEDLVGNGQVFDDHLLELFLDESVLLFGFAGLILEEHEIEGIGFEKDDPESDVIFEGLGEFVLFRESSLSDIEFFELFIHSPCPLFTAFILFQDPIFFQLDIG